MYKPWKAKGYLFSVISLEQSGEELYSYALFSFCAHSSAFQLRKISLACLPPTGSSLCFVHPLASIDAAIP